jgi:hypothetical protein
MYVHPYMRRNHVTAPRGRARARAAHAKYGRIAYYVTARGPPAWLLCIRHLERHFGWPIMPLSPFWGRRIPHGPNPHGLNRPLCYVVQNPIIADSSQSWVSIQSTGRFLAVLVLKKGSSRPKAAQKPRNVAQNRQKAAQNSKRDCSLALVLSKNCVFSNITLVYSPTAPLTTR